MRYNNALLLAFFSSSLFLSNVSVAQKVIANDGDKMRILVDKNYQCSSNLKVTIDAKSAGYFDQDAEILQKKIYGAGPALSYNCRKKAKIEKIDIHGLVDGEKVFQADAYANNNWNLFTHPAPLELAALNANGQEPTFDLVADISALIALYSDVEGITDTYQYDFLEKELIRILDDRLNSDPELFKWFLLSAGNNGESFEIVTYKHQSLLDTIKRFAPEPYPDYEKIYASVKDGIQTIYWKNQIQALTSFDTDQNSIINRLFELAQNYDATEYNKILDQELTTWSQEEFSPFLSQSEDITFSDLQYGLELLNAWPETIDEDITPQFKESLYSLRQKTEEKIKDELSNSEAVALQVIEDSYSSYRDIDEAMEALNAISQEFDQAGFSEEAVTFLEKGVLKINKLLATKKPEFDHYLSNKELNTDSLLELSNLETVFEGLEKDFSNIAEYNQSIKNTIDKNRKTICSNQLKANGVYWWDLSKKISFLEPKNKTTWRDLPQLMCDLNENGHQISEFKWLWWPGKYQLSITDADGEETSYILKADRFFFGKELRVVQQVVAEDQFVEFTQEGWTDYIAALTLPPPNGEPDANGIRECDRLAGDPDDSEHKAIGLDFNSDALDLEQFDRAIDACIAAVEHDPEDTLQQYQLGRLFWYSGEFELAKDYLLPLAGKKLAPALYFEAQITLLEDEKYNTFVTAYKILEVSAAKKYAPAQKLLKELNPDNDKIYYEISPPSRKQVLAQVKKSDKCTSFLGFRACSVTRNISNLDCFQISATDFSCEYKAFKSPVTNSPLANSFISANSSSFNGDVSFSTLRKSRNNNWSMIKSF